jgi:hypothetical protein
MDERKGSTQLKSAVCDEVLREGVTLCPGIGIDIGTAKLVSDDIHIPRMHIGNERTDEEKKRYREALQRIDLARGNSRADPGEGNIDL